MQYLIWVDENGDSTFARDEYVAGPWLNQQTNNGGWQSLGVHTLRGRVRIEVRDTRARDDWPMSAWRTPASQSMPSD